MSKSNFRQLTEQDIGKAFIREVPRSDSERFGYYSVLRSMGSNLGRDPLISFWTFDIDQNQVVGKHTVSDFARTIFSEAGLPADIVQQGIEACERVMAEELAESRAAAEEARKQRQAKIDQYGKSDGLSFIEEGDLETTVGKYVLWIDDNNACYQLEVYPSGKDAMKRSMKWGHEPRFGMDIEDSWKLFGNAKLGIKGLLREMEEQIRETEK